jgi:predicted RNA-binding protein with RPS1 domain
MLTRPKRRYWSGEVTRRSNALDLKNKVFTLDNPRRIALSLKRSADTSKRRKATPFQSAMSMLNFYINRAGSGLSAERKRRLTQAKEELRKLYHRS